MTPPDFECFAPGTPRPQGSKTRNANGSMREASKHVKGWRQEVVASALQVLLDVGADARIRPPLAGPLILGVEFLFLRPLAHYGRCRSCKGTRRRDVQGIRSAYSRRSIPCTHCRDAPLKQSAPIYMTGVPDKDKLVRAVGDALKIAGVVKDDSLFVRDHESGCKRYANPGEQPGAWIRIWKL